MDEQLEVEQLGSNDSGICDCCGGVTRTIWGQVRAGEPTRAVYYVRWTTGHVSDGGANVDIILGTWGDGTTTSDRTAINLEYRLTQDGPSFMVRDAERTKYQELAAVALEREQVVGHKLARDVFAVCDAVLAQDSRVSELLGQWVLTSK